MKRLKLLATAIFFCQVAMSQYGVTGIVGSLNMNSGDFVLFNIKGVTEANALTANAYAGVENSPFASDEWAYARIRLADGRGFDSVLLRINLYENKVHFKDENGREKMIGADVKEIEIRDAFSKLNGTMYVAGYGEDKNEFYQVIADGKKVALLKKLDMIIKETKVFNAPDKKSFELKDGLYIYAGGTLYEATKNCSSISWAFKNDKKATKFMDDNGLKCNKEKDLKSLVEYYNSY